MGQRSKYKSFHEWLRSRMNTVGVSQTELVNALSKSGTAVGHASISRWINGKAYPPREIFPKLLQILAVHGKNTQVACRLYSGMQSKVE